MLLRTGSGEGTKVKVMGNDQQDFAQPPHSHPTSSSYLLLLIPRNIVPDTCAQSLLPCHLS